MVNKKPSAFTPEASPVGDNKIPIIKDADTANYISTIANILALYDAIVAELTNKTFDAEGTGNSITNIADANVKSGAAIALAKLANITSSRILGRVTAGSGAIEELTVAQIKTLLALVHTDISDFDTGVQENRLDQMAAPTASVSLNSQKITNLLDPASDQDADTKSARDAAIVAALTSDLTLIGDYDASTNTPDLDTSPSGITKGDYYIVTVAGTFFTEPVAIGDSLIAKQDNPTQLSHWILTSQSLTAAEIKTLYESNSDTNEFSDAEQTKLAGIEDSATADQSNAEIKTAYEANADTNAFTDADESKLDGIASGAEVNPDVVSQAEAEAGTATTERIWTAERVSQAIAALGGGGGGFSTVYKTEDETINSDTVMTDDADLQFSAEANGIYAIILLLHAQSETTPKMKYVFSVPSGASGIMPDDNASGLYSAAFNANYRTKSVGTIILANGMLTGQSHQALVIGTIEIDATPGTVAFQWAQSVSDPGDTTLQKGSFLMYKKLN